MPYSFSRNLHFEGCAAIALAPKINCLLAPKINSKRNFARTIFIFSRNLILDNCAAIVSTKNT